MANRKTDRDNDGDRPVSDSKRATRVDAPDIGNAQDPDKTVGSIDKTVGSIDKTVDSIDKTVDSIDKTVDSIDKTVDSIDKTVDSIDKTVDSIDKTVGSIDKTVDNSDKMLDGADNQAATVGSGTGGLNATVELELSGESATLPSDHGKVTVPQGDSAIVPMADVDVTIAADLDMTIDGYESDDRQLSDGESSDGGDDVSMTRLGDSNINQTIDPRGLSDADVDYWGQISSDFSSSRNPSPYPPAIERSLSESRLQLRGRQVTTPVQGDSEPADYRLVRLLGQGGMGNVFVARQQSLDRLIALKAIKPIGKQEREQLRRKGILEKVEQGRRQQFLSEAVVTGDLDHPNIVPIYDVAVTGDDTLFYAMKRVVGTPWSEVISEKTRDENIEILIKVSDAVGFAHTRGVIHRDIKPENVMLGDFGVVTVMDWGLALTKPNFEKLDSITGSSGLGGTPSFMAPEMAIGPIEVIGPAADIYLLGATLFMIITGRAPHHAPNVSLCLRSAALNQIAEYDPKHRGELLDIALKAMAADPADRYQDVRDFQSAIRSYRSHSESIALTERANADLRSASADGSYEGFSRAEFGFQEAINLWSGNTTAHEGLAKAKLAHAEAAHDNEDFDLGLSLLDRNDPDHQELVKRLESAQQSRRQREARFGLLKRTAAALLMFIFVGGTAALYLINDQKSKAELARAAADASAIEARQQTVIAEQNERLANDYAATAVEQRKIAVNNARQAEENALRAEENARRAEVAQANAEYESYVSRLGLAKARIDRNEFDDGRRIIRELRRPFAGKEVPWELRWLSASANQSRSALTTAAAPTGLALSDDGDQAIVTLDNGAVIPLALDDTGAIRPGEIWRSQSGDDISAVAVSAGGDRVAFGTLLGEIQLWSADLSSAMGSFRGHQGAITDLRMISDRWVVSSSADRTVRVWDMADPTNPAVLWHIAPVVSVAAVPHRSGMRIAAAVADKSIGRIVLWDVSNENGWVTKRTGVFARHEVPVTSVALAPSAQWAASGDASGNVMLWQTDSTEAVDVATEVRLAVENAFADRAGPVESRQAGQESRHTTIQDFLVVSSMPARNQLELSELGSATPAIPAHRNAVRNIAFNADASRLLTCGDDYTVKVWDCSFPAARPAGKLTSLVTEDDVGSPVDPSQRPAVAAELASTLRGHGGWVFDAAFVGPSANQILSVGNDRTIRLWDVHPTTKLQTTLTLAPDNSDVSVAGAAIAHRDEIWSARFDASGERVVTASRDHTARLLSVDRRSLRLDVDADLLREAANNGNSADASVRDGSAAGSSLVEGSPFRAMSMAVDPQHRRLFVGSADSIIRIWDLDRGTEVASIKGTGLNDALALSRDGRTLVTGSSSGDAQALVWRIDANGQAAPQLLHRLAGHADSVAAIAISPESDLVFTGDRGGRGILWDAKTGAQVGPPIDVVRGFRINSAAFTDDGSSLLIASDSMQLTRLDLVSRRVTGNFDHDGFVSAVAVSDDENRAVTIAESSVARESTSAAYLWDLHTGEKKMIARISAPLSEKSVGRGRPRISSVSFEGRSARIAVAVIPPGNTPNRVEIWDSSGGVPAAKQSVALQLPTRIGDVTGCAALLDKQLLTLNGDGAFLWNLKTLSHQRSFRSHGAITRAVFSADGRLVATGSRSVKVWDTATGVTIGKLESPHDGVVRAVAFSPNRDKYVIATGGSDGAIRVWRFDPKSGDFQRESEIWPPSDGSGILCLAYSPDGRSLLSTSEHGNVTLHDLVSNKPTVLVDDPKIGAILAGRFSPDGAWIAVGGADNLARLWKVEDIRGAVDATAEPVVFRGHAEPIEDVAIIGGGPETLRLFTASRDQSVRLWDPRIQFGLPEGRELLELRGHSDGLTAVDVTPDGDLMMTAGRDGVVILWPASSMPTE